MNYFLNFIPDELTSSLGWTLLHSLWQGTLLTLVAAVLLYLMRGRSAKLRYLVSLLFLSAQVFISSATFFYYGSKAAMHKKILTGEAVQPLGPLPDTPSLSYIDQVYLWVNLHINELVFCWLVGALLLMTRLLGSWLYLQRLRDVSHPVIETALVIPFCRISQRLGITRTVEFRESSKIVSPLVMGALKPVVLIPMGLLTGFSTSQIEALLAHELAHVKRHDYLIHLLQSVAEIIFFFHPALWWLSQRINAEREHCCDDLAIEVCDDRMSLAHALVKVAEQRQSLAMAFLPQKKMLLVRIRRVMGLSPYSISSKTSRILPVLVLVVGILAGVSVEATEETGNASDKLTGTQTATDTIKTTGTDTRMTIKAPVLFIAQKDTVPKNRQEIKFEADSIVVLLKTLDSLGVALPEKLSLTSESLRLALAEPDIVSFQGIEDRKATRQQLEKLRLDKEKLDFDRESIRRKQAKLDWQKKRLADSRMAAINEQANLMKTDKNASRISEAEQEKQLESLEQKVKTDEQKITQLSSELSALRLQDLSIEDRIYAIEQEMKASNYGNTDPMIEAVIVKELSRAPAARTIPALPVRPASPAAIKKMKAKPVPSDEPARVILRP